MRDIIRYLKQLNLGKKIACIFIAFIFAVEMEWAVFGSRIYHTYVPVQDILDFYVLIFPFLFAFINFFAIAKKRLGKFLLSIDFVMELTYPPVVTVICFVLVELKYLS